MKKAFVGLGAFALIIGIILIALPFVYVPKTVSQAYQVPQSSDVFNTSFVVPPAITTQTTYLDAGDTLNIQVTVTGGGNLDINFNVNDGATTYLSYTRATTISRTWTVPLSSNYNFVYDNSFSTFTSKDVTVLVTKNWTTTAYKDVTTNSQLLPFEVAYVGVVLALAGIGITIYGVVKKEIPKSTPSP